MTNHLNSVRRSLFFISTPMVFITFALPLRAEDIGGSAFEIGALYSIFTAAVFIIRPLAGFGLDYFGRKPFFIAALILYFLANAVYALSAALEALYFARLIQGAGFSLLAITTDALTADLTQYDGRGAAMGGNIASQSRGGMLGAFVGFTLVGAMPQDAWRYSFLIYAGVALAAVLIAYRTIPETKSRDKERHRREKFSFPKKYYPLIGVIFLAGFAMALIQPYYLIYLRSRFGLELAALAAVFIPMGIAYAILPVWLGRLTNSLNRITALSIGFAVAGALYLSIPHINAVIWITVGFTVAAAGTVLVDLTKSALIADIAGPDAVGRTFGLAAFAAGGGAFLGPLAGGFVYDSFGAGFVFYLAGACFLTAIVAMRLVSLKG